VIAGTAKGTTIRSPSSPGTRPIGARGKEALFSILMPRLPDARFLDLFAGTGGVGIEALSRGAASASFVELDDSALEDLRFNLERTRVADRATVVHGDAFKFLARPPTPFDVLFVAPPQWRELWERALLAIDARPGWIGDGGVVVVQCDPKEIHDVELTNLERLSVRSYGGVAFIFFGLRDVDGEAG
jgi:16S rRNA (guanine966-N2)-methyltransferase